MEMILTLGAYLESNVSENFSPSLESRVIIIGYDYLYKITTDNLFDITCSVGY